MNMFSNNSGARRRRRGGSPRPEADPLDRDYGYGYSEEGRPITGITDGNVHDPQAEIFDEKGETMIVNLADKKSIRMCDPGQHNLVKDGEVGDEIPGAQAMSCTRCPYGEIQQQK